MGKLMWTNEFGAGIRRSGPYSRRRSYFGRWPLPASPRQSAAVDDFDNASLDGDDDDVMIPTLVPDSDASIFLMGAVHNWSVDDYLDALGDGPVSNDDGDRNERESAHDESESSDNSGSSGDEESSSEEEDESGSDRDSDDGQSGAESESGAESSGSEDNSLPRRLLTIPRLPSGLESADSEVSDEEPFIPLELRLPAGLMLPHLQQSDCGDTVPDFRIRARMAPIDDYRRHIL